jgi:hypothetical protein
VPLEVRNLTQRRLPMYRGCKSDHFLLLSFCDRLAWRAGTTRQGQYGALCAHISWPAGYSPVLSYYMEVRHHHLQKGTRTPARTERSQLLWTFPGQISKDLYRILSTPTLCQRQHFVDTNILSTHIFFRRIYFVNAYILLPHIFCCRLYFVDAYILSVPIFCCRLYLLPPIFLHAPMLSPAHIFWLGHIF